jgi:cytochrome b6-f complex iron-sulfur subunit
MAYNPYENPRGRLGALAVTGRRQFLLLMGAFAGLGALILGGVESLKFLYPGVTGEAPPDFKVTADPKSIGIGQVVQDTAHRVSVVRDSGGFYAVYLVCTHLGCTPNYSTDVVQGSGVSEDVAKQRGRRPPEAQKADGWACPCHGSRYFIDSTNFYGPAPRPMDWVKISLTADKSQLIVDRSAIVVQRGAGVGTAPNWRLNPDTGEITGEHQFA